MKLIRSNTLTQLGAVDTGRYIRPTEATHFQVTTFVGPAAVIPSAYAHVVIRGLLSTESAANPLLPLQHVVCEWDLLEHPYLYGQWIPLPDQVTALAVINGANPGCAGVVARGCVLWGKEHD